MQYKYILSFKIAQVRPMHADFHKLPHTSTYMADTCYMLNSVLILKNQRRKEDLNSDKSNNKNKNYNKTIRSV
ncbi:hypothetical protein XENTR_v10013985 [Xenopus tropicalis]|nr:hypothetical protein XENTR_v10013985 [Xenopus tropicalis]